MGSTLSSATNWSSSCCFFFFREVFIYLWLCWIFIVAQSFPSLSEQELTTSSCPARASHRSGFSCCGAQTLGAWTSMLHGMWNLPGPWTWDQTRVPCIGRWILNLNHQRSPVTWLSGCTGAVGARPARPELTRSSTLSFRDRKSVV